MNNSSRYEEILLEDNLCDNKWHQLNIKVMEDTTYAKVDVGTPFNSKTRRMLSLDKAVVIGGAAKQNIKQTISNRNFHGCVSDIILNGLDVLQRISKQNTNMKWGCEGDINFDAVNFDSREAFVSFLNPIAPTLDIGLQFRTYYQDGILITNEINNRSTVKRDSADIMGFTLYFEENVVKLRVQGSIVVSIKPSEDIDFGSWHAVRLQLGGQQAQLTLGTQTKVIRLKRKVPSSSYKDEIFIGKGTHITETFRGWIWKITMNDKRLSHINATGKNAIIIGFYRMKDYCYPNRCENGGRCIQMLSGSRCNCSKTGYEGATCSKRIKRYKKTCYDYYISGKRTNGNYVIEPASKPMRVYCKMDDENGPKTVVRQKQGHLLKEVYQASSSDNDFYYHNIDYTEGKSKIDDLLKISGYCRQYIEYFCSLSTLMFSNDKENALANRYGARWFSSDGKIQHYWGGGNKQAFTCACGLKGNCADPALKCNCDIMDSEWRTDSGFLDDKNDLPVSKIQFSRKYTKPSAMYKLGPLECFGEHAKTTKALPVAPTTHTTEFSSMPSITTKVGQQPEPSNKTPSTSSRTQTMQTARAGIQNTTRILDQTKPPTTVTVLAQSSRTAKNNTTVSPQSRKSTSTATSAFAQGKESLSADIATRIGTKLRSTSKSLLSKGEARQTSSAISGKQMIILVTAIASLALLTILLIAAVLRQRLFKSNKKLTIELKQDPENCSPYSEKASNNERSFGDEGKQYRSMSDINRIEIIRVASPFRKPTASESESSVSSFDTSRYLEVGEESDSGSSSSFTKRKGILKSNSRFVVSSRPRSEGDIDDPEEVIGLIHINSKKLPSKSDESASLLSESKSEHLEEAHFHLHPRDASRNGRPIHYSERDSYSDRESVDAETGFITDSSSSCDSRKSLSSSGSDESNDEFYSKKIRKPKRSVRFSIQELSPMKTAKPESDIADIRRHNDVYDEVFT